MDWISDHHLSKIKSEESGMDGEKPLLKFASQRNDIRLVTREAGSVMVHRIKLDPRK